MAGLSPASILPDVAAPGQGLAGRALQALVALAISAGALFGGLVPSVLRTGRIDPFDWLLPGLTALLLLILFLPERMDLRRAVVIWALVALPPALFVGLAGLSLPVMPLLGLLLLLGLSARLMGVLSQRRPLARWLALLLWCALLGGGDWARQQGVRFALGAHSPVGLMTALPLDGEGRELLRDLAIHAPLVRALERSRPIRPLDRLDAASLADVRTVLLAQPRQLAPAELVALDRWVRDGGLAVILADPLLHWRDPRPFGDPARAPLTSLLDPLLAHWGLVLEPARIDGSASPVERRLLADGSMLRLAGAARFTRTAESPCRLSDAALIATCLLGEGEVRLVADADWANDVLWTSDPVHPRDRRAWTSDAIPMLSHLLARPAVAPLAGWTWVRDGNALVSSLRWALLLAGAIALASLAIKPVPSLSHSEPLKRPGKIAAAARSGPDST